MTLVAVPQLQRSAEVTAPRRGNVVAIMVIFGVLWVFAAFRSEGFGPADGCMHYLFARFAWHDPHNFVDVWARPLCTLLYALPAVAGGRIGVCMASFAVALGCGAVAFRIARGQGLTMPALALLFTLAQPLLFVHTLTAMTELPFALLLSGAFLAYQDRRWLTAALLIALTPLARPEGFGFLLIAAIAFIAARRWGPLLLLPLGLIVWDLAGWWVCGRQGPCWGWLGSHWPWSSTSMYGRGSPLTFIATLPVVVSPLILPATLMGIGLSLENRAQIGPRCSHLARCRMLTAILPLFVLGAHSILYATGKLASFGEPRYLLVVAPFWGVLSARGADWFFARLAIRSPWRWAIAAAMAPVAINVVRPVVPLHADADWKISQRAAAWYQTSAIHAGYPTIGAAHPGVFYHLDKSPTDGQNLIEWKRDELLHPRPGALLFWDPVFGNRNASPDRAVELDELIDAGWVDDPAADAVINEAEAPGDSSPGIGTSRKSWHVLRAAPINRIK